MQNKRKNILVIDPDKEFGRNVRLYLEEEYGVFTRQGLMHIDYTIILRQIQLIICEAEFLNNELLVLIKRLREKHPPLKLIVMYTYLPDDENIKKMLLTAADDLIAKPFDVKSLKNKVDALLGISHSRSQFGH